MIRRQGIQGSFCLKKQILVGQPARAEFRCFERRFQPAQQTLEFCEQLAMFLTAALDAFPGRYTEDIAHRLERLTGNTAMNDWIPNEVQVQERPRVVAVRLFHSPSIEAQLI